MQASHGIVIFSIQTLRELGFDIPSGAHCTPHEPLKSWSKLVSETSGIGTSVISD
jgi:hypothetical protein